MNRLVFDRWTLDADPDATRAAYSSIAQGSPEVCGCDPCLNFAASRQTAYPATFRRLLVDLGIPCDREAEIYHNCRLENGLHSYGGWFHFVGTIVCVGTIVSGTDAYLPVHTNEGISYWHRITDRFAAGVSVRTALVNEAFASQSVLQLKFDAEIPWAIGAPEAP